MTERTLEQRLVDAFGETLCEFGVVCHPEKSEPGVLLARLVKAAKAAIAPDLAAIERYAHRLDHGWGHSVDRESGRAILRIIAALTYGGHGDNQT